MAQKEQRALLFVVDQAKPAVELIAELFGAEARSSERSDRVDSAHLLTRLLRDDGYEVGFMVAGNDMSARLSRSPRPDALVADVSTPQGGSLEVARQARRIYPNLPLFVITDYPELIAAAQSELSPQATVFSRPLDYAEFSLALGRAARKHSGEYVRIPSFLVDALRTQSNGSS